MFNGIIYNIGKVQFIKKNKKSIYIGIKTNINFKKKDLGASVSCDGVCLTIAKIRKNIIYFYISKETLKRSNFKLIKINQLINLEKSISFGQTISGHFIQGHVDTVAKLKKITFVDKTWLMKFQILDRRLSKFLMEKASISINVVSLTISKVNKFFFEIHVLPCCLLLTSLKNLKLNNLVNIELDIFSKYIHKYSN